MDRIDGIAGIHALANTRWMALTHMHTYKAPKYPTMTVKESERVFQQTPCSKKLEGQASAQPTFSKIDTMNITPSIEKSIN